MLADGPSEELPIAAAKGEIVALLSAHDFVVIVGDTGSGKTTQIPTFLLDADDAGARRQARAGVPDVVKDEDADDARDDGVKAEEGAAAAAYELFAPIAVTQPRRVAATSVSARVAHERGEVLGDGEVGYKVRFDTKVGPGGSRVTFMTDGVLVRECVGDPTLAKYNTVMLDEAHERSVDTDVLFGLVKRAVRLRRDKGMARLRIIIASATLDADRFSGYFEMAPVLRVPGRAFDVDIYHSKTNLVMTKFGPASRAYVEQACDVVMQLHETQPAGHVLVFLTGQDEIERACDILRQHASARQHGRVAEDDRPTELVTLPLYGALQSDAAARVFEAVDELRVRKVVVATNIAETSLTVPGVKYVVDPGYVKLKGYDPSRAVASLVVVPISKVAAEQRAGRAGRTAEGQCYRLYSRACFDGMAPETIPEIRRSSMSSVALALKSLDILDVLDFDFVDAPDPVQLGCALLELHALGALDAARGGRLTADGRAMATLALEPPLAKAVIEAAAIGGNGVRAAVLSIAAMLSSEDVWYIDAGARPSQTERRKGLGTSFDDRKLDALQQHAAFRHPRGDLISLLVVFAEYDRSCGGRDGDGAQWCRDHSLRLRALKFARKARQQLDSELQRVEERSRDRKPTHSNDGGKVDLDGVCEALCAGLCLNAAERSLNEGAYVLLPSAGEALREGDAPKVSLVRVEDTTAAAFKTRGPACIVFHELRVANNSRGSLAKNICAVKPETLERCRRRVGTSDPHTLSGRTPPPPEAVAAPQPRAVLKRRMDVPAAPVNTAPDLDSARARYLARKRAA